MDWRKNYKNVLTYSAGCDKYIESWCNRIGYKKLTTFFMDLGVAEWKGENAIKETYRNVMNSWLSNVKYITEFIMCLAWKSEYWYGREDDLADLYADLYYKAQNTFYEHYKDDEKAREYFWRTTD